MQADRRGQSRAGARARVDADRLVGRTLDGRYRLTSRIARGGMAAVYEAIDLRLDRTVAVKVMHVGMGAGAGGLGDETAYAARFVREARAAARLSHPNVVAVYDQGEDDGSPYLVMELVPGHTLRDTITEQSPMAPQRALAVLEPVLAALAAAHRAGLVHRDVKPENVLISDEGAIKVADFGLARAVTADTQHTSTGVLIGTVSYIAPEIVTEGRADARADVYSAGVLLYELLTGRKPHEGETPIQVAYKHVHEDVPPPSRLVPGLPAYVDALVARATAREPGLRPADAGVMLRQAQRVGAALAAGISEDGELTADLSLPTRMSVDTAPHSREEHLDRTRTVARSGPVPVPLPAPPRRRRRGPLAVVLAVLLVAAVGVGAWWFGYARYTSTPGVLGLTQQAATARLERAGLEVAVGSPAYSDTIQAGRVLRTEPGAGGRVLHGGTVTIVLSKGVEQYRLPDLAGKSVDQAQDALLAIKMTYGKAVGAWSDTVPAGQVIRSDPAAGTVLRPGTPVDVWVSKGRQPVKVADWTGKVATTATAVLEKAGLIVQAEEKYSDDVPAGRIISQSPDAGTLYKGDTVSFVVSRGPELVEVPGVTGHGIDSATHDLQAAGFKVNVEHYTPYFGLGFVMKQDHAGDKVPKGSTITVWIS